MSARVWREVNSSRQRHVWDILSSMLRRPTFYRTSLLMLSAQTGSMMKHEELRDGEVRQGRHNRYKHSG
jgi:hypothetical protein